MQTTQSDFRRLGLKAEVETKWAYKPRPVGNVLSLSYWPSEEPVQGPGDAMQKSFLEEQRWNLDRKDKAELRKGCFR